MNQQLLLKQDLAISQILREHGKMYRQIKMRYSDGREGRCAMGVVLTYFGWDGRLGSSIISSLQAALPTLSDSGFRDDISIIELNDSGMTFDEIADYLDKIGK